MATTVAMQPSETVAGRGSRGQIRITHPTRAYAVSGNPFSVPALLPLLLLCFIGLDIAIFAGADPTVTCGAFLVLTCGLLLIPAVTMRGSMTLTHDGVTFESAGRYVTAFWTQVSGLSNSAMHGLCIKIDGASQSCPKLEIPGGLSAIGGEVNIPLRMFGDRQFSVLYDMRDRLPQERWMGALNTAGHWDRARSRAVYFGVVAIACGGLFAAMYAMTH
jgi:hypothetical protein